jgi:hypothetical protein
LSKFYGHRQKTPTTNSLKLFKKKQEKQNKTKQNKTEQRKTNKKKKTKTKTKTNNFHILCSK